MEEVLRRSLSNALFDAYLSGGADLFFPGHYTRAEDRLRAVRRASRPLAPQVAHALVAQNLRLPPSGARDAHIEQLRHGAAAVVTGQQVGLFLGPLYTIYKAATAIRVAQALAAQSRHPVVPVFWLQTEDHDLEEIAVCPALPSNPTAPPQLNTPEAGRVSIAHCVLPDSVDQCLAQLGSAVAGLPHAGEHLSRLARHYRPGRGWAEAFAGLLAELFADEGLVVLDPRHPDLARAAVPVHRRALESAALISATLLARSREIAAAGFTAPVHVRPGAPLFFYHPDGPVGPRYRLQPGADGFAELGGTRCHTSAELLAALESEPLSFSTSALLRPILQDTLLPTAAYVGGPAEIAYFAQLAPLYAIYDLAMPLIVPRARFRIVDGEAQPLLARLGIDADAVGLPDDELLAAAGVGSAYCGPDIARTLLDPFERTLDELHPCFDAAGPELNRAAEKTRATVRRAVAKLADRCARTQRDPGRTGDLRRLKLLLYPNGTPQERFYGLAHFASQYGDRTFVERILGATEPFGGTYHDMYIATNGPLSQCPEIAS